MTQLSLSSLNDTVELQGTLERVVFHNEENGYTVFRVRPEGKDEVDLVTVVGHMGSPQAGLLDALLHQKRSYSRLL